jgi:ribosomal protein L11 methyltransferase
LTALETFLAECRPALDVQIPRNASTLVDLVDAIVDDCHPYAIEELNIVSGHDCGTHDRVRRVHFFSNDNRATAALAIANQLGHTGIIVTSVTVVNDGASWASRSQANLRAIRVGRVVVAPPWDLPPDTSEIIPVIVNPSTGFGTGHHSTTRLCLRALQTQPIQGRHVTDVGTGSAILAITAAKLNAASVLAIENDLDAASAGRSNIAANGVGAVVTLLVGDVRTVVTRPASCVLANLTGALLTNAARLIARCVEPGGILIVSGLTMQEESRVVHAFEPIGCVHERLYEENWVALVVKTRYWEDSPHSASRPGDVTSPVLEPF